MEEIFLKTDDNIKIAVNNYKSGFNSVLIIAPGWFMTKDSQPFKKMSEAFAQDTDVLAMDFRGRGDSSGFYTFTTKEVIDLKTVVDYAKSCYEKVYLLGFSLGAALVIIHSALEQDVDKVIAVSAPCCFEKIENHIWKKEAWLPTFQKFELKRWVSVRPSLIMKSKIKPLRVIKKVKSPTLFIVGEYDKTVYPWHTELLYKKALCEKKFVLFEDCLHAEDLFIAKGDKFITLCKDWLLN